MKQQRPETDIRKAIAEELRLIHKEFGWANRHIANIYAMIRTEDTPPLEDPNQLKLFPTEPDIISDIKKLAEQ